MEAVIGEFVKQGGGYLIAALFIYLFLKEQSKREKLYEDWMEDTKKSTETLLKSVAVLESLPDGMAMMAEKMQTLEQRLAGDDWRARYDDADPRQLPSPRRTRSGG